MRTEYLVGLLSRDLKPVPRHAVRRLIAGGSALGVLTSVLIVAGTLGFRPDLWLAMQGPGFWMKFVYTLSIAAVALAATGQLARPQISRPRLWPVAIPVSLLFLVAVAELFAAPKSEWSAMWLGRTAIKCPLFVFGLALPIFAGLLTSMRQLAPTHLRVTGAVAGLAAGGFAATVYCLHCPEVSAIFVFCWYSLGIILTAIFGAMAGPRFLRW